MFHEWVWRNRDDGRAIPRNAGKDAHIRGRSHAKGVVHEISGLIKGKLFFTQNVKIISQL
jgi:hypothetical protein